MPVLGTLSHDRETYDINDTSGREQPSRAVFIEQRSDLHAEEKREENIDRGYPSDGSCGISRELVVLPVREEETRG